MKKLFALVLVLCMLSASAFAEVSPLLQNELPPEIVTSLDEAGEIVLATIYDKDGNKIADIKEDGTLELVDVHHRKDENGEISNLRLTMVYEDIMDEIHHGDVECELHDHHDVKVCVDDVLNSLETGIDSHDLTMYELFDVVDTEALKALLVDGNYMELTLEVEDPQWQPLITLFSADGVEWRVLPTTQVGDKQFTVRLTETGTIALLADSHDVMGVGKRKEETKIELPGDVEDEKEDNFTPSISGKPAPELVPFVGEDGKTYIAIIYNANGEPELYVPDENYILITAVAERDYVGDIQTHEHLEWAYDSILNAEDVGDLYTTHEEGVLAEEEHTALEAALIETLEQMGMDITPDQLVVKDLFEVTAYGDYLHALYDDEYSVELTFQTTIAPGEKIVVIHSKDSIHWHVHPIEEFVVDANGQVTLRMYDLGVVAFLVEGVEVLDPETAVQSPN